MRLPRDPSAAGPLSIIVDSHERYPWRFLQQRAETQRRALVAGDYAVELGEKVVASVERKSLDDLVSTLTTGKLSYLLADLAALPRAALVIEDRYSSVFRLHHVRPAIIADGLAEAQVRFPSVPIIFCETRPLAEEWTYRFLGAALEELASQEAADAVAADLNPTGDVRRAEPTTAEVRAWASASGIPVSSRGRIASDVWEAYRKAQS